MQPIRKQIVTDKLMRPVAVLIDYKDWQAIEKILEAHQQEEAVPSLASYAGVIKLAIDPLEYQQQIRNS